MSIDHIRLSASAKEKLIRLKRWTGVQNWNVLCRWAFCVSLADHEAPPRAKIITDSSVEMTWKVFGGQYQDVYIALLKERCRQDNVEISEEILAEQFKLHLHRGIDRLAGEVTDKSIQSVTDLVRRVHPPDFLAR